MKGKLLEDNKFLQEVKFQYYSKHEDNRQKYRQLRQRVLNGDEEEVSVDPARNDTNSAHFLALYKKGLTQLVQDDFILRDLNKLRNVENEIARTEVLVQDETLKTFARDNKFTIDSLLHMTAKHPQGKSSSRLQAKAPVGGLKGSKS